MVPTWPPCLCFQILLGMIANQELVFVFHGYIVCTLIAPAQNQVSSFLGDSNINPFFIDQITQQEIHEEILKLNQNKV
jgi:hypothetical protein